MKTFKMKTMGKIVMLLTALLFNTLTGAVCASVLGFSPAAGAVGMNAVAAFMGMAPQSASILREGVYTEIWTGELVKVLRAGLEGTWLSGIPDQSSIVNNDVIHLVEVGVDPDVLINNKTYPIDVQALEDKDIAIKLEHLLQFNDGILIQSTKCIRRTGKYACTALWLL